MSAQQIMKQDPAESRDRAFLSAVAPIPADSDYDWRDDALCSQVDPELFFPPKGGSTAEARRICDKCDVREQCLEYAIQNDEQIGIWGGLSKGQRNRIKNGGKPPVKGSKKPAESKVAARNAAIVEARKRSTAKSVAVEFGVDVNTVYRAVTDAKKAAAAAEKSTS